MTSPKPTALPQNDEEAQKNDEHGINLKAAIIEMATKRGFSKTC